MWLAICEERSRLTVALASNVCQFVKYGPAEDVVAVQWSCLDCVSEPTDDVNATWSSPFSESDHCSVGGAIRKNVYSGKRLDTKSFLAKYCKKSESFEATYQKL